MREEESPALGGETQSVSQPVFVNEDIYRINKLTTTDKALYRFYVADKSSTRELLLQTLPQAFLQIP